MTRALGIVALAAAAAAGCGRWTDTRAPWIGEHSYDVGRPVLGSRWEKTIVDTTRIHRPQEMATAAVALAGAAEASEGRGTVYLGAHDNMFRALAASDGSLLWKREIGPVSGTPLVLGDIVYVGTDDGALFALDAGSGAVRWKYDARGGIVRPPVAAGDMLLFTSQTDHLVAVDRGTGKFRWQYERDMPDEFTVRGHAGVAVDGDRVYTGFADGHLVSVALATGEVLWVRSLAGEAQKFVDVDTTPVVLDGVVYAASVSGGLWGIAASDGTERWRTRVAGATQLALDDGHLYVAAADTGLLALDLGGNILWRQGFANAGDPAPLVFDGTYLFLSVSEHGLYVVDKRDGRLVQSFLPGPGITASAAVAYGQLYVMSNGGVLYAMSESRF